MDKQTESVSIGAAAAKGALAGLAGAIALMLVEQAGRRTILPAGADTTPAAARAVKAIAEEHGASPSRPVVEAAGVGVELAWCAALGALFGIVHSRVRGPALVDGLALAAIAYAAVSTEKGMLPRIGMSPPMHQNVEEAAIPIASEVAFGITTAAVFEAIR